jgi:hypothetical protein
VTERDAFGNLVGGAGPTEIAPPPPPPPPRGPRQWPRALVALTITALFFGAIAVGGWLAYGAIRDATRDGGGFLVHNASTTSSTTSSSSSSSSSSTTSTHTDGGSAKAARGLAAGSLLRPAAFARTLTAAHRAADGQLRLLRLAPARADLQLARTGGGITLLQLRWNGDHTTIKTPGSMGSTKTITYSGIDRTAPQRLVTAAAHRLHRSTKSIDYLVLIAVLGPPTWSAYFQGGAAFQGDAHGRIVQRIQ